MENRDQVIAHNGALEMEIEILERIGIDGRDGMNGEDGKAGVSVNGAEIDASGNLIIKLTDDTSIDAGRALGDTGITGLAVPATVPAESPGAQMYVAAGAGRYDNFIKQDGYPVEIASDDTIAILFRSGERQWWESREIKFGESVYLRNEDLSIVKYIDIDPSQVKWNTFIARESGQYWFVGGVNISGFIPVKPGNTYKITTRDHSVSRFYEAFFTYSAPDLSAYVRPVGSDVNVDETIFRAAENERFIIVVTKTLGNQQDTAGNIIIEDITPVKGEPIRARTIALKGRGVETPDYDSYVRENGASYGGDAKVVNSRSEEILGFIAADGALVREEFDPVNRIREYSRCYKPICVEGFRKIRVTPRNRGKVPPYFSCYSGDNFTGFLGRTNGANWDSIGDYSKNGYVALLPEGTRYISAVTLYSPSGTDSYTTTEVTAFNTEEIKYLSGGHEIPLSRFKPYERIVRFQVDVNCNFADCNGVGDQLQDAESLYKDWGVLMLPENYDPHGKPVTLIIGCHGGGGSVDGTQSQTENVDLYKYLVANGFAVMDMNGLPHSFAAERGVDVLNNIGSPIAVEAYLKGYQWVVSNYNVRTDGVLLCGGSMGGLTASNIANSGSLKVLAQGVLCPVLDTYSQAWLNPWSGGVSRTAVSRIYGFADESVYEPEKVAGFNPILKGMIPTPSGEMKNYPCPLKIWHCNNDPVVNIAPSIREVEAIRRAGGYAELRRFFYGEHEPSLVGAPLSVTSGNRWYNGTPVTVYPAVEELFLWFRRFSIH